MDNKILTLTKEFEGQKVAFRINSTTGQSEVRINEVAGFCGWVQKEKYIRWDEVLGHLANLGFTDKSVKTPSDLKGKYIPEYIMYPLIGRANNDRATKFMLWVGKVLTEIRNNGGYILDTATKEQIKELNNKWAKKSIYLTKEIHDRKSIRKFIREYDKMKMDECIDKIAEIVEPMKGSIKHELLDVAIKELKEIDAELIKDTPKHTYIKDTATEGIIILQDIKIGKQKRRINTLEQAI